jgi:pimeloyl-ACP methyl ester carboxylesterase
MEQLIHAEDGRALAVEHYGNPHGRPAFLLHGTPGSRLGPAPRGSVLYRLGIRLITYDRPGYGASHRLPRRSVAHVAADVSAIADALGIGRFAVVGRSRTRSPVPRCCRSARRAPPRWWAWRRVTPRTSTGSRE